MGFDKSNANVLSAILDSLFNPEEVEITITGSKFTLNHSEYIPFSSIGWYDSAVDNFNYGLSNSLFELLDIQSDSTVFNTASFVSLLLIVIAAHIWVGITYKLFFMVDLEGKWWLLRLSKWTASKSFALLTFGYYIRTMLEMNQYLLVSSFMRSQNLTL